VLAATAADYQNFHLQLYLRSSVLSVGKAVL